MSKLKFAALILAALMAVLPICGTISASAAPVDVPSDVQTSGDGGSTQDPQADTIPTEAEPHASLPAETENTEPVETEPTIPSEIEGSEPTKTEDTEPSEEVSAPAEGKSISLPGGVTIAKVTTCSNIKENGNTVDQNTDTVSDRPRTATSPITSITGNAASISPTPFPALPSHWADAMLRPIHGDISRRI